MDAKSVSTDTSWPRSQMNITKTIIQQRNSVQRLRSSCLHINKPNNAEYTIIAIIGFKRRKRIEKLTEPVFNKVKGICFLHCWLPRVSFSFSPESGFRFGNFSSFNQVVFHDARQSLNARLLLFRCLQCGWVNYPSQGHASRKGSYTFLSNFCLYASSSG
ncbi:hypothetical protein MKW98_002961 [Papaver atlanticum]|uniref:Uncharacterized protein n=1 Tax=Papaver atlanticum TaxID=357466 RepID=A0AAD4TKT7_9MAGN|nr:hypothetical protein MKW98_002961 [Papaver atlanticum]